MKRLFIIGCPRSGSTWTTLLLAQHPEVVASQHVGLFHDGLLNLEKWWAKHEQQPSGRRFGKSVIVLPGDERQGGTAAPSQGLDAEFVPILTSEEFYGICRAAAEVVYRKIVEHKPQAKVVVDKTPESARAAELIVKVFPDAYFLHIIRDPRSVFCSLRSANKTVDHRFPTRPIRGARGWCIEVERARKVAHLTPHYKEVRYEALLERGPAELGQLFSWLGVDAEPSFCEKACEAAHIDNLRKLPAPRGFFRKGLADGWREELSAADLRIIEYVTRDLMDELGYEPALNMSQRKPVQLSLSDALHWGIARVGPVARRMRRGWQS
jgi:hypothetical protein